MNSLVRFFLMIAILTLPLRLEAQVAFCGGKNNSFLVGEKLHYKVYYNMGRIWVGAGEVTFTVNQEKLNGRNAYHIVGDGRTLKSYEWFYKVRDRYESYVDMETLAPLKFIRNVNEGGFKIYNNVTFNHQLHQAVTTQGVYKVPECVQDVLSAIYYARNIDFSKITPGSKIPFSMFLDDQVYNLYVRYLGKEQIKTKYGTFNTIKFSPLLINGTIFKGGEKMTVWVSDDPNHVPVRIDSPITVGSIKVDLIGYQNLRHPLRGLVSVK